ncbi:MAG: hypothetical protein ACYYK0_02740 [Candidatus Eutrophobiaceae bacterium]
MPRPYKTNLEAAIAIARQITPAILAASSSLILYDMNRQDHSQRLAQTSEEHFWRRVVIHPQNKWFLWGLFKSAAAITRA